jgi:hypothetical protein
VFGDTVKPQQRSEIQAAIQGWRVEGKFGFHLDILDKFPEKFIEILLGINVPICSVRFPQATFTFSRDWDIPVWLFPEIDIVVRGAAMLSVAPPPIALMSDAIIDAVRTRNPVILFTGLALSTQLDSGAPRWIITGWLELGGGASISIGFYFAKVTGEATIFVHFSAQAKPANPNGEAWLTFDQIALQWRQYGVKGTVDLELKLAAGLQLKLKACVNLILAKKCWTLASKSWSRNLFDWKTNAKLVPAIASPSGTINGDAVDWASYPHTVAGMLPRGDENEATDKGTADFLFTAKGVAMTPYDALPGGPALTRKMHVEGSTMRFSGNPCTRVVNIVVSGDIANSLVVPSCPSGTVNVDVEQDGFDPQAADQFSISRGSVAAAGRPPISLAGGCGSFTLS